MTHSRHRVLLAAHCSFATGIIGSRLTGWGFEVVRSLHGLDLVEHLRRAVTGPPPKPFDLLIVDPRTAGLTSIIELVESARDHLPPPVIVITQACSERERVVASAATAVTVLDRPFDAQQLESAVQTALRSHPRRQALERRPG